MTKRLIQKSKFSLSQIQILNHHQILSLILNVTWIGWVNVNDCLTLNENHCGCVNDCQISNGIENVISNGIENVIPSETLIWTWNDLNRCPKQYVYGPA